MKSAMGSAIGAGIGLANRIMGGVPTYEQAIQGLELEKSAEASILRDGQGVPTIVASTLADTFALHGFAVGQDRLWQVHSMRFVATGRAAELNAKGLTISIFMRQLGVGKLGAEDWAELKASDDGADAVTMVESFVRGINFAANSRKAKGEMFMLSGSKWEPLTAEELCAMWRLIGFSMSYGFQHSLIRQWLHDVFGEAGAEFADTVDRPGTPGASVAPPTVDPEMSMAFATLSKADREWAFGPNGVKGEGSNWFVVSGERSASGKPLLAGDPHLAITIPGFWYQVTYRGAVNCTGMAAAPLPGILLGHNGKIGWSVTLGYTDIEDLFIERFRADGMYEHKGAWHEPEVTEETIQVKGEKAPRVVQITRTRHGPLLEGTLGRLGPVAQSATDRAADATGGASGFSYKLAYAGLPIRPKARPAMAALAMLSVSDFAGFDAALAYISDVASLNFGFASTDGHIGYVLCGRVPLGRGERGNSVTGGSEWLPLCGWSGEHDYTGWLPHAQLPKVLDPPTGVIVSANHMLVEYETYPHYLGQCFKSGYRATAIHTILEGAPGPGGVTMELMRAAQLDERSIAAAEFARLVTQADVSQSGLSGQDARRAVAALDALRGWDGNLSADSTSGAVYQCMHSALLGRLLAAGAEARRDALPPALLTPDEGPPPVKDSTVMEAVIGGAAMNASRKVNELQGHTTRNLLRMLHAALRPAGDDGKDGKGGEERSGTWWLTQAGGFNVAVCAAAAEAEAQLERLNDRSWGALHQAVFKHPITASLGFAPGSCLDVIAGPSGGDTNTPRQASIASPTDLSATGSIASARILLDMADLERGARAVTPLGVCEVAGSPHLSDNTESWHRGEYQPLRWTMEDIRAATKYTTTFASGSGLVTLV